MAVEKEGRWWPGRGQGLIIPGSPRIHNGRSDRRRPPRSGGGCTDRTRPDKEAGGVIA